MRHAPIAVAPGTRVAVYARYSSDRQSEHSIEDQLRICRAHAERQGWTVVREFHDAAISGIISQRPRYQALQTAMRAGEIDIVLAEALDRFSRDQEHIAAFHKLVGFTQVRLVTISDGDINALHVGLKGTMNALYLTDLAAKTRRGIEGRIRAGRATGKPPYGYRRVTSVQRSDGEIDRGLRAIVPEQACVVRRIFTDYAAGLTTGAIARALNAEGVPGPSGRGWQRMTIAGRPGMGDGMLRNRTYVGELVWNQRLRQVDPTSGAGRRQRNDAEAHVVGLAPAYRVISDDVWEAVQKRLAAAAPPADPATGAARFWERRPPRYLLTGKLVCGVCGDRFAAHKGNFYSCSGARIDACTNRTTVPRAKIEAAVLAVLAERMMDPDLAALFAEEFTAEWNRLAAERGDEAQNAARALAAVEHKLANVIDAIADGLRSSGLQAKLSGLEAERDRLAAALEAAKPTTIRLMPNLGQAYRRTVGRLRGALEAGDNPEALEAARALIDRVIIRPFKRTTPPDITVEGHLGRMLAAAQPDLSASAAAAIARVAELAVKEGQGGRSHPQGTTLPKPRPFQRPARAEGPRAATWKRK